MSVANQNSSIKREDRSQTPDKAKAAVSAVGEKTGEAGSSVASMAGQAACAVGGVASDVGKKAEELWGTASDAISSTVRDSGQYLSEAGFRGTTEDLAKLIRQNPISAVCIAFGMGWVLARTLKT